MSRTAKLTLTAMLLALGLVLPFLTGQIPQIGKLLLPMHLPVFLCGLLCGWRHGACIGFLLPPLRSVLFGAPVFFPAGTAMAFELMSYGLVIGLLYHRASRRGLFALYRALLAAMLAGRAVWGLVQTIQLGLFGNGFTLELFLAGAFVQALPGILLQLLLIPGIMLALERTRVGAWSPGGQENAL